jgi:FtsH-binding integral membrane protein
MQGIGAGLVAIVAGIIGLAIVAVVVSKNAQTGTVLTSGGSALASIITAAVSPVATSNTFGSATGGTGALG